MTMRGALIGFGSIATGHLAGYAEVPELDVVAVVDSCPERRAIAARFGLRTFADYESMHDAVRPDFVDVCTPPATHRDLIRHALTHDVHVLCEKPVFVPDAEGYLPFIEEIRTASAVCYPCHNYKFAPILELMQDVVHAPEFGPVVGARFRTIRTGHALGVAEWAPHWRRDSAVSAGGILRDHGPHSIYLMAHLTGQEPVAVSCIMGNLRRDAYQTTEDTALLTIRCADGAECQLDVTWSGSYRRTYYSVTGESGSIAVDGDEAWYTVNGCARRRTVASEFNDPTHRGWFGRMFRDFMAVLVDRERQLPLLREALMTSLVIDAGYESAARDGAWIDVHVPTLKPAAGSV